MGAVVQFEGARLPAYLQQAMQAAGDTNLASELAGGIGLGFPVISFKGKEWAISEGGTIEPLIDDDGEALRSIEVIIVRANPSLSKTYYANGYVPGSADPPDCFSNDGVAPDAQAAHPQAAKCAACPHAVWGSKITDNGSKAKACADAKRTAVMFPGDLETVYLLRVPAASLKDLAQFADTLGKRRVPPHAVVTKVSFVTGVAHPQLAFKASRFAEQDEYNAAEELRDSEVVRQIVGLDATPATAQARLPAPEDDIAGTPPTIRPTAQVAAQVEEAMQEQPKPAATRGRRPGQRAASRQTEEAPAQPAQQAKPATVKV